MNSVYIHQNLSNIPVADGNKASVNDTGEIRAAVFDPTFSHAREA